MKKTKKRFITLMEIMIVIVLIGLIGGVLAYNMRGSLEQGKLAATEHGGTRVYNILMLAVARGANLEKVASNWETVVADSGLAKNADKLCRDGWGIEYTVTSEDGNILVTSDKYNKMKGTESERLYFD